MTSSPSRKVTLWADLPGAVVCLCCSGFLGDATHWIIDPGLTAMKRLVPSAWLRGASTLSGIVPGFDLDGVIRPLAKIWRIVVQTDK